MRGGRRKAPYRPGGCAHAGHMAAGDVGGVR
nr:MAG TPA: hypothetical protein [Caudoviricetes sp.]